ncbi:MAG TPA: carboxypeptidase-like regulatory domain-containing protein [Gemmataceae bacterium]|nr:carboxypeptidase-like regulatory domain-containing protein [Gemmataceae bacterium]
MEFSSRTFLCHPPIGYLVALTALVGVAGCGSGNVDRKAVSGTVKFNGAPLVNGSIQFAPTAQSKATTQAAAEIHNGKYEFPAKLGLEPGNYQVRILSGGAPRDPVTGRRDKRGEADMQQIPAEYNIKTTLEREVTPNGPNNFDFDLTPSFERPGRRMRPGERPRRP